MGVVFSMKYDSYVSGNGGKREHQNFIAMVKKCIEKKRDEEREQVGGSSGASISSFLGLLKVWNILLFKFIPFARFRIPTQPLIYFVSGSTASAVLWAPILSKYISRTFKLIDVYFVVGFFSS